MSVLACAHVRCVRNWQALDGSSAQSFRISPSSLVAFLRTALAQGETKMSSRVPPRRVRIFAAVFLLSISFTAAQAAPGDLDTTFNATGKVTTAVGSGADVVYAVAIQTDGKIVLAGYSFDGSNNNFALVRYN